LSQGVITDIGAQMYTLVVKRFTIVKLRSPAQETTWEKQEDQGMRGSRLVTQRGKENSPFGRKNGEVVLWTFTPPVERLVSDLGDLDRTPVTGLSTPVTPPWAHPAPSTGPRSLWVVLASLALVFTVLYYTVQYSIVQYFNVLYSVIKYSTLLYCAVQSSTILYCTVLFCTVQYTTVLEYVYFTIQYT